MTQRILEGNVFDVLPTLEKGSVDCCVTSPPYWKLRSYLPKDHPLKPLELGSEPTPQAFVDNLVRVFRLVRDALADHGTVWLNIGDTYSSQGGRSTQGKNGQRANRRYTLERENGTIPPDGIPAGNLCLIPQRLAIALQDDGWIVRSIIVWHKPAPMPASVSGWAWRRCRIKVKPGWDSDHPHPSQNMEASKSGTCFARNRKNSMPLAKWQDCPGCKKCKKTDGLILRRGSWRPTSSYEPILMLAKTADYFADGIPNQTKPAEATVSRDLYSRILDDEDEQFAVKHDHETICSGANARDVQTWAAEPLSEKHYAAFPTDLVQWCLRAGTSAHGYCALCGKPWVRVIEAVDTGLKQKMADGWDTGEGAHGSIHRNGREVGEPGRAVIASKTIGWSLSCSCVDAGEPRPALVLDPFAGSGRTGISAMRMGLNFVGCELNPDYVKMARKILHDEAPLFATVNSLFKDES